MKISKESKTKLTIERNENHCRVMIHKSQVTEAILVLLLLQKHYYQ